jgi:hypothetical protein
MIRIVLLVIVLALILIFGGVVVLSSWDPSPPSNHFEKVVPDERFPR